MLILKKIKEKGFSWFLKRTLSFIRQRESLTIKILRKFKRKLFPNLNKKNLYAFYDLNNGSPSYNLAEFLIVVEDYCIEQNYENYSLVIVPKEISKDLEWKKLINSYGESAIDFRTLNLFSQLASLSPKCKGFHILKSRNEKKHFIDLGNTYPEEYGFFLGKPHHKILHENAGKFGIRNELLPTKHSEEILNNLLRSTKIDKKIITLTIRNSNFEKSRNSDVNELIKFAVKLESLGFLPILIPDSDNPINHLDHKLLKNEIGYAAAYNPGIRLALYRKSLVNFLPDNGPTLFCLFSKNIPYIVLTYKTINNNELEYNYILPSKYFCKETGRLIWGKKNQWFYEGKDNCENLEKIFKEYYFTVHKKQI